ncbi:hypothetical protein BKA64DRAFT_719350 [Cadophora sp. MPI-SDFR-AT-0126]|nr:hypothetical protein BKA64DRAFT_719350 [Leotiomycetes sp. MPI-SDFR-AT-0126]
MKAFLKPSILLATVSGLVLTSALSSRLEQRQGQVIDTAPTVADCANGPDCKLAAAWWNDCQGAHVVGMPFDPSSNVRSCLCPPGRVNPSHIDWYSKLRNCIICAEMAAGTQHHGPPMYMEIENIAGSPSSSAGYCHGTLSTKQFVEQTKELVKKKDFPLALPEAVLRPADGEIARAVTPIGSSTLAVPMPATTLFSIPTAPAHSGFTETAPTAIPNSLFTTFPAVPMSSVLASISAASSSTPTAIPNSLFSTFDAVPMSSFLASLSSSFPTAVANGEVSTFQATPMSSVLSSISSAMTTTSLPVRSSKTSARQVTSPSITASTPILKCNHDNCLRAAIRSEQVVMDFCATYTKDPKTAGTGFPSCLLNCDNSPVRISSACSCLASHTSSISNALPTSTSKASSLPTSFATMSSSSSHTSTSKVGSLPTDSTTTPSSSSPTVYPTANPTKWISLPASEEVKSCAASMSCVNANTYHDTCLEENDKEAWKCLCEQWPIAWKTNLGQCTQCLENALPRFAGNGPLTTIAERARDQFCSYTGSKSGAKAALVTAGAFLTEKYQSSLALFNMTLIDAPYRPSQTSPASAPPGNWASLPASPEVVACSGSPECMRAAQIFNTCAAEEKKAGGNVKFCFCNTNINEWKSSLSACAGCIAKNLPNSPPSNAPLSKDKMVESVEQAASIYCEPASQGSVERLHKAGLVITTYLQSPVKFFDMSLVTEPILVPS